MNLLPFESGVLSPRALDSCDASLAASCAFLLGVCRTLSSTSANTALFLLGEPAGSMSNRPRTMPSRWGVGPMTLGPCGDKKSGDCGIASVVSSSSRFLFKGVDVWNLGCAFGVRSMSWVDFRLAVRFEGVWGAAGVDNLPRSLLYSLYLFASPGKCCGLGKLVCRVHTYVLVRLDIVASGFPPVVLGSELLFP
jgi:hypothetical protein